VLKQIVIGAALFAGLSGAGRASAQTTPAAPPPVDTTKPNDYSDPKSWLCRPGSHDACDIDETTTVVAADGKLTTETWKADPNAPIDCFYVYPTVSTDPGDYSDMNPDPAEINVVKQQFARFASKCRPYAPMYRQITLVGLRKALAVPNSIPAWGDGVQYKDVRDAWNYYLEHDNKGRGVVLVAHSQGSFILIDLIRREIDGKPIQSKLVSAILMGTVVPVPKGKDVGGAFQKIPLCHSASQLGCLITFASFRSTVPPPANTLFGKVPEANMAAACTNPAALAGGSGELHSYLSNNGRTITGTTKPKPWVVPEVPIETPWVSVPGLLTAKCSSNDNASGYLEITVNANPSGARVNDIVGDIGIGTNVLANWGLHLVDVNITMGNLIDIVGAEAKAYASKK